MQRQFVDETIHDISYPKWRVAGADGSECFIIILNQAKKSGSFFQEEPLRMFCSRGEKISALILGDYREFKSVKLSLLGASGQESGTVSLQFQVDAD